jgi:hypothetical protein
MRSGAEDAIAGMKIISKLLDARMRRKLTALLASGYAGLDELPAGALQNKQ